MPNFRSNSSANTTMDVNVYQIARGNGNVTMRCDWAVHLGSGTGLGIGAGNNRILYINPSAGGGAYVGVEIKSSSATWAGGSTYNGTFNFVVGVDNNTGSLVLYIQTNATGVQSCIWTNRAYCVDFGAAYSEYWSNASSPGDPRVSPSLYEGTVTLLFAAAAGGINNAILDYHVYYRLNGGAEVGASTSGATSLTLDATGWGRGTTIDFHVAAITQRGDNPWSGWSGQGRRNRVPNTPTNVAANKGIYAPGETIRISFTNTGDPDGNMAGIEVRDNNGIMVGTGAAGAAYVDVPSSLFPPGATRQFQARGYDSFEVRGGWSAWTAAVIIGVPLKICVGGTWRTAADVRICVGGSWRTVSNLSLATGGAFRATK